MNQSPRQNLQSDRRIVLPLLQKVPDWVARVSCTGPFVWGGIPRWPIRCEWEMDATDSPAKHWPLLVPTQRHCSSKNFHREIHFRQVFPHYSRIGNWSGEWVQRQRPGRSAVRDHNLSLESISKRGEEKTDSLETESSSIETVAEKTAKQ